MALTGRFTFRRTWTGKILLQVEEEVKALWPMSRKSPFRKRWRNATLMDLAAPEMRALMDLRFKPQFMAQYEYLAPEREASAPVAPQAFDGVTVAHAHLQHRSSRPRIVDPETPAIAVEVQSQRGRMPGRERA